jgi:single-stranded-DNA-specific exonuclease
MIVSDLLVTRGITDFDEAKSFFRPSLDDLHDPFLIKDMDLAVDRLSRAMKKKEKILVYGDYDVDGTTAVSLVYGFLHQYTSCLGYYIPDRYSEGYGVSANGVEFARENGYQLIIALDCGIKANDKVKKASESGIDFIICDHHTPDRELPKAVAVLDSQREDCHYPYQHLSGCGVGFKFMQAFAKSNDIPADKVLNFIDLVAVSIASDIVPITGENRVLAYYGLQKLNQNPCLGLQGIKDISGLLGKNADISDVVFKIGPRINASGRMRTGSEVVELLTTNNTDIARAKCSNLNDYNTERKDIDKATTEEAKQAIYSSLKIEDKKGIVIYNPLWNKGIVGIVASRLTEEFHRPAVVLTNSPNSNMISGSARSVQGFDLYSAIDSCRDLLDNFGGHLYAAGLSLLPENLELFKEKFEKYVEQTILPEQLEPQIEIDTVITLADITPKFVRILKRFNPFGPGNMKPVFCSRELIDFEGKSRLIGKDNTHLKLVLSDIDRNNCLNGVAFHSGEMRNYDMANILKHIQSGGKIDICYTIEENTFNGQTDTQLMVKDIRMV